MNSVIAISSKKLKEKIERAKGDVANAQRDGEVLIKGAIHQSIFILSNRRIN